MTLAEIRECLANPEAWRGVAVAVDSTALKRTTLPPWLAAEVVLFAEERASNIAAVLQANAEADAAEQAARAPVSELWMAQVISHVLGLDDPGGLAREAAHAIYVRMADSREDHARDAAVRRLLRAIGATSDRGSCRCDICLAADALRALFPETK